MKQILPVLICLLACNASLAQQDPLFTHFWNAKQVYNPAYTGLNYRHNAEAIARWQWDGVNGAPNTQLVSYGFRLNKFNSGLGLTYLHDEIGFNVQHQAKLNYAYHMTLTEDQTLSFGLSAGIINTSSDPDWVVPTPVPDPYLPQAYSQTEVIGDIGFIYRIKRFTTALSVTQLTNESSTKSYQSARHYYFNANYNFGSEEKLQIRPQLLIRTDLVKASMDVNSLFIYKNRYTLGLTYRTSDALCILAGYTVRNKFTISYSYDLTINKLSSVSRGSHEIHLGFLLK